MDTTRNEQVKVKDLLTQIESGDPDVRTRAWLAAGAVGPTALQPLAKIVAEGSLEVGRAAQRAMWNIVHTVGAPEAEGKKQACAQLASLLADGHPTAVRRDIIWMLSEISDGGEDVNSLALLLNNPELQEDARCALQRMPGDQAVVALKAGFAAAPDEFKYALADSLRRRGQNIDGYPSRKMIPTRQTQVKPVGRA